MLRFALAVVLGSMVVHTAAADVADVFATDTWSATSSGTNGFDSAFGSIDNASSLNFSLSQIPAGATILSAAFISLSTTASWVINDDNGSCATPVPPLTIFGETVPGCSDILGAQYLDSFGVDGFAPNGTGFPPSIDLIAVQGGPVPYSIDPSAITANGTYSVPITASGSMEFVGYDQGSPIQNGTPPVPSFSMNGTVNGELEVQYSGPASVTPEPSSYIVLLAILLLPLTGIAIKRHRAAARQSD
jgi:hypothetical protein